MKKCIAILISLVLFPFLPFGCTGTNLEKYENRISDYRDGYLSCSCDDFTLKIVSGRREDPYELDGNCRSKKVDYTVFTLSPKGNFVSRSESVALTVELSDGTHNLNLTAHPFKDSFSSEVGVRLSESEKSELSFCVGEKQYTATAVVAEPISAEYALTLALETLSEELSTIGGYEIYLRLTENTITAAGGWYWYVAFYGKSVKAVLISATDGSITAVRK